MPVPLPGLCWLSGASRAPPPAAAVAQKALSTSYSVQTLGAVRSRKSGSMGRTLPSTSRSQKAKRLPQLMSESCSLHFKGGALEKRKTVSLMSYPAWQPSHVTSANKGIDTDIQIKFLLLLTRTYIYSRAEHGHEQPHVSNASAKQPEGIQCRPYI